MRKFDLFALSIALSKIYLARGQVAEQCMTDDAKVYFHDEVASSFSKMLRKYNETCAADNKCSLDNIDPLSLIMDQNYEGVPTVMRRTCQRQGTHKACTVNTKVRIDAEFEGFKASIYRLENKKPVCVPNTCSDEQINIVDPSPSQCDPNIMNCVVEDYGLKCKGQERVVNDTDLCAADVLPPTHIFNIQRGVREVSIFTDCTLAFQNYQEGAGFPLQPSGLCQFSTGPVNGDLFADFTGFEEDDSYQEHADTCRGAGGDICHLDMYMNITVKGDFILDVAQEIFPLTEAADVNLIARATHFPRCFAPSCAKEYFEGLAMEHFNRWVFEDAPIDCDQEGVNCIIRVDDVRCPFFSDDYVTTTATPTSSPIPPSRPVPEQTTILETKSGVTKTTSGTGLTGVLMLLSTWSALCFFVFW